MKINRFSVISEEYENKNGECCLYNDVEKAIKEAIEKVKEKSWEDWDLNFCIEAKDVIEILEGVIK